VIRVVVESPFGRNVDGSKCTPEEYARNTRYLNRALLDSLRRGESPYASHRFFPGLLDDTDPADRELGMRAGLVWAEQADVCAVYDDHGLTEGMLRGIAQHAERGMVVERRQIGQESIRDTLPVDSEPIPYRLSSELPEIPKPPIVPSIPALSCDEEGGLGA
jgi:hypothetical protein